MSFLGFLAVAIWIALVVSSVLLVRGLRRSRPPSPGAAALHDLSEAAFLVGGPANVVDAALATMLADTRLVGGGPGIVQVWPGARANDPAERAVLQAHQAAPSGWLYQVRYAAMLDPAVQEIGDALAARGLLSPPGSGRIWRRWGLTQTAVCTVLIPLSLPLTILGAVAQPDTPAPFVTLVLPVLLAGIVVGAVCAARAKTRLTPAGIRALHSMRRAYQNDQSSYVQVSLLGLRGLRDPYLRQQLVPAARGTRLAAAQSGARAHRSHASGCSSGSSHEIVPVVWCAGSDGGGGGSSCGSGAGCGSSSGGGCGSSGSSSSCSSSSGSSCSSSSGSSCSSSSSSF
ncbi:TIGR04222 domain-containing membrane protein [Streptomyces sp. NPDC091371]|uniref:TIGR04222 domain-containing membrane protein n=1 Tax=Streptomyces sp. NPDC091371 TaxID=3155303 RepID=UPI00342ACF65